jgi:CheY-like chemotaxis protein
MVESWQSFQALTPCSGQSQDKGPILVIEDSAIIVELLSWALRLRGYSYVCVANGQEAYEWMENALLRQRYPAAILLDLYMPVMDGRTFLQRLRTRWDGNVPIPPIILMVEERRNYEHLGCSGVLIKPFHIADLFDLLQINIH